MSSDHIRPATDTGSSSNEAPDISALPGRPSWHTDAACRGRTDVNFFPTKGEAAVTKLALAVCSTCPVVDACREEALTRGERFGIWGGLTERQRRRIRSQRRQTKKNQA